MVKKTKKDDMDSVGVVVKKTKEVVGSTFIKVEKPLVGYLENVSTSSFYALKRSIHPGERVPLEYVFSVMAGVDENRHNRDKEFVEVVKDKFNDNQVWKVVVGKSGTEKVSGKVKGVGGKVTAVSDGEVVDLSQSMGRVRGIQPLQAPPIITEEMLISCDSITEIEKLVSYVKGPADKKKLLHRASDLCRNRPGKEVHFRVIEGIREKLMLK